MGIYLEPLLAVVGFAFLVAFCAGIVTAAVENARGQEPPSTGPYHDGLDAAARISAAAFVAERELYLAAEQVRREEAR
jgi:hypothetical protein